MPIMMLSSSPRSVASPLATVDEEGFSSLREKQQRRHSVDTPSKNVIKKNGTPISIPKSNQGQVAKNNKKRVRFSELSHVLVYDQQSIPSSQLYYT